MMSMKEMLIQAAEDGYVLQVSKYKELGEWSDWKVVSLEKALKKLSVKVCRQGLWFEPYKVRVAFEYRGQLVAR